MSKEVEFCKLVVGDEKLTEKICRQLKMDANNENIAVCLGFLLDDKLVGGVVYSDLQEKQDVWISILAQDKRWCCRRVLKNIFDVAFNFWHCRRINALIDVDNFLSLKLAIGVGFKIEGLIRNYREDGKDVFILGMLQNECKFLSVKEK